MVVDLTKSKFFIFRILAYFFTISVVFKLLGVVADQNLAGIFKGLLNGGDLSIIETSFQNFSLDSLSQWVTDGVSNIISGVLSVIIVAFTEIQTKFKSFAAADGLIDLAKNTSKLNV